MKEYFQKYVALRKHNMQVAIKKAKNRKIADNAYQHKYFCFFPVRISVFAHKISAGVVQNDGKQHDKDINGLAPAVKGKADDKKYEIPEEIGDEIVNKYRRRKIKEQEFKR